MTWKQTRTITLVLSVSLLGALMSPPPAAAALRQQRTCFEDATQDTDSASAEGTTAFPKADIVEYCLGTGDSVELSLRVAEPTDPVADPNWDDADTFAAWGLDTDDDGSEDYTVVFGIESNGRLEGVVVDADADAEVCTADAVASATYDVAGIPLACLGDPSTVKVAASMSYDSDAANPSADVFFDHAPDDGTFVGHAGAAAPCDDAPVAAEYDDRDEARETHRRSIDCVIFLDVALGFERNGQTLYAPRDDVTRAQMATFVVNTIRAAGHAARLPNGGGSTAFIDIEGTPHAASIKRLERAGIVTGTDRTHFSPRRRVSRQQMATFLLEAAEFVARAELEPSGDHFGDVGPSNPHRDAINAGFEAALFTGTSAPQAGVDRSGAFSPGRQVRRDQMASFLTNLIAYASA